MEGKKSIVDELFPRNSELAKTAKLNTLDFIFPVRSPVVGKDSVCSASRRTAGVEGVNQSEAKRREKPLNLYELSESCLMSSSIYYGGRDDFIPHTSVSQSSGAQYTCKNNKEEELGSSELATRGDWWQGSFYY